MTEVRLARLEDALRIWEIRNSPETRERSTNQEMIGFDHHYYWFNEKYFVNQENKCFVVEVDKVVVGYCRLDANNDRYIVSIAIDPTKHGQGLGTILLREALVQLEPDRIILASVKKHNIASIKIFLKCGFKKVAADEAYFHFEKEYGTKDSRMKYLGNEGHNPLPLPDVLRIEPASSCNFKCIHCPTGLGLNSSLGIMKMETFDAIYERIRGYKFSVIALYHGGEPLLNRNLYAMISKLKPLATDMVKTVTNGSLLTDHAIEHLLDSEIDMIEISMDGNSPAENNEIRKGANFSKIAASVVKLIRLRNQRGQSKPRIYISNTQIPKTKEDINRIEVPQFLREAFEEVADDIVEYKLTHSLIWPGIPLEVDGPPVRNYCHHTTNGLTIRWNGDIVACCYDLVSDWVLGNILEQGLEEIWNNTRYQSLRRSISKYNPPPMCKNCTVLHPGRYMIEEEVRSYLEKI